MLKKALWLLGVSVVTPFLLAQTRFTEFSSVVLVEIPVQVEKDGTPVRGLTRADFEVRDGRKRMEIIGFDVIDLERIGGAGQKEATQLPVAARRHFLFLFDLSLSDPSKIAQAQTAAAQLASEGLHPSDLAAVATYSNRTGVAMTLGFTSDRGQLDLAIQTLGLPQLVNRTLDPLSLTLTDLGASRGDSGATNQRGIDAEAEVAEVVNAIEGNITVATRRNQMTAFTAGLAELARILGGIDGRKHVVLLSEGFDASGLVGAGVQSSEDQRRVQQVSAAAAEGRIWEVGDDARFGSTEDQGFLRKMAEEFIRADCMIQSVDIGGLRAGGEMTGGSAESGSVAAGQDGLFLMAEQTGGGFYRNFNRLDEAMDRMLERTSVTYVLAIQPDGLKNDGKFHRLKVKLKKDVKGTRVAHRQGYFAPKPSGEVDPMQKKLSIAGLVLGGEEGGSVRTAAIAAAYDLQSERAHVPVLIEVDGASLLQGQSQGVVPTEIYVYGINEEGAIIDFFTRALGLDLAEVGPALSQSGLKYWGHLELPPGNYRVRVVVRNDLTGQTGVNQVAVRVPDVFSGEGGLWPPMALEAPGKWIFGRERPEEQGDYPYPFVANGQPFVPAARATVAKGASVSLVLAGYELGVSPEVSAALYRADGSEVEGCEIVLEAAGAATGEGPDNWISRFSPGQATPGDYRLVVTASGADGASYSSEIALVVEG